MKQSLLKRIVAAATLAILATGGAALAPTAAQAAPPSDSGWLVANSDSGW
jgi:hypothetical protein